MRKVLILVAVISILLLSVTGAAAQGWKQAMRYEIKGGLVSTYVNADGYADSGVGWGWTAGGGLFLPLFTRYFGVEIDALYLEQDLSIQTTPGGVFPGEGTDVLDYEITGNYLEIPLLAQLALSDSKSARFYFLGGVSTKLNTAASIKYTNADGEQVEQELDEVTNTEWTPIVGFGVRASALLIELRFAFGTANLGDGQELEAKVNRNIFMLGFSF